MLFNAYVVQTMLYRVEIWGGNISPSTWNDIEKRKKAFLCWQLDVKATAPYLGSLLQTWRRLIKFHALIQVMHYIVEVQHVHKDKLPRKAWEARMKLQNNHKSKIVCTPWGTDTRKWFNKWNVESYLTMPPERSICKGFSCLYWIPYRLNGWKLKGKQSWNTIKIT